MKHTLKRHVVTGIFLAVCLLCYELASAAGPPNPPGGDPPCWPAPCIPIDGGIGFLIAAGLAYGGKKAYDSFKDTA